MSDKDPEGALTAVKNRMMALTFQDGEIVHFSSRCQPLETLDIHAINLHRSGARMPWAELKDFFTTISAIALNAIIDLEETESENEGAA